MAVSAFVWVPFILQAGILLEINSDLTCRCLCSVILRHPCGSKRLNTSQPNFLPLCRCFQDFWRKHRFPIRLRTMDSLGYLWCHHWRPQRQLWKSPPRLPILARR